MTSQSGIGQRNHRRAVRFFWVLLVGATLVSVIGNVTHVVLPYVPRIVVQIGAAAVPPVVLLAAVHGIALAVRAGASSRIYHWAVAAVALIGVGAFAVSFLALRDLMQAIGYSPAIAWVFPAIIDTTVGVSTLMLVALGDKPPRRSRTMKAYTAKHSPEAKIAPTHTAKSQLNASATANLPSRSARSQCGQASDSVQPDAAQTVQTSAHFAAQVEDELASDLIASGVTTQPVETVVAVLTAYRGGASINATAKASGINYRTAQRIVEGVKAHRHEALAATG
jgi:hypothetical protein